MDDQKKMPVNLEQIKVKGNQLVDQVRDIIEQGSVRRVTIKKDNRTLLEFPLSVGVGGAAAAVFFAPTLAAIGAFAALVTDVQVEIERVAEKSDESLIVPPSAEHE